MPGPPPTPVPITARQRAVLESWKRQRRTEKRLHERACLILGLANGLGNAGTATHVGVGVATVSIWRRRWKAEQPHLAALEDELDDKALMQQLHTLLSDNPRSGTPPKFTPEQVTQIIKLATTPPSQLGRPISHWTTPQLANEAIKQGIVTSISPRQVGRFLKSSTAQTASNQILGDQS